MSLAHSVEATFLQDCVVPALKGQTLKAAKQALTAHSCSLGKVKRTHSTKVKKGHVIAQKPRPHEQLRPGAEIDLTISRGRR
jgi:beta-lactam-binding protein with PASTA domain